MLLAAQMSDDQIAIIGCAVVFGACIGMMLLSQKIGNRVRGRSQSARPDVVRFPIAEDQQTADRKAA